MELSDRDKREQELARKIARLTARQRKEFDSLLGFPPDPNNVPKEFWDKVQQELNDDMTRVLLLIAAASYSQHGGPEKVAPPQRFDQGLAQLLGIDDQAEEYAPPVIIQWAKGWANDFSRLFVDRSQEIIQTKADAWEDPTVADARDLGLDIFGPDRAARIAATETTRAQHFGSEAAIAASVGLSDQDLWFTVGDSRVCPICEPLHNTPRSYWGRFFPGGPPDPHPVCRCYILYANAGEGSVA